MVITDQFTRWELRKKSYRIYWTVPKQRAAGKRVTFQCLTLLRLVHVWKQKEKFMGDTRKKKLK